MSVKKVIQIEYLDGENILSKLDNVNEQLIRLNNKLKFIDKGNNSTPKQYYSRKEVKEIFEVSYTTLNSWAKQDILKTCRLGSRIVYRAEDIEKAVKPTRD